MTFISYAEQIKQILNEILKNDFLHAKWLNTLSYLENCGAKKIAACQHPTLVKEEMLKHAAEEFRHAHYLKRQIPRVSAIPMETYLRSFMLGNEATLHYLTSLDLHTCRYLKSQRLATKEMIEFAYLLVTYAIERRADELYKMYEDMLRGQGSRVTVKSILLEEQGHLQEMQKGLQALAFGMEHAKQVCAIESALCQNWLEQIQYSIE